MVIPAYDEIHLPCDCRFEEFIIIGIIFNRPYWFFGNHKLGKLIDVADDPVNGFLFQTKFGTVEDCKVFADHISCDNDSEFPSIPLFQNQNQCAAQRTGNDNICIKNHPFHFPSRTARISASIFSCEILSLWAVSRASFRASLKSPLIFSFSGRLIFRKRINASTSAWPDSGSVATSRRRVCSKVVMVHLRLYYTTLAQPNADLERTPTC